jgi:hypothetical protein
MDLREIGREGVDWIYVNFLFPQKAGNSLTNGVSISCSRSTLLQVVSWLLTGVTSVFRIIVHTCWMSVIPSESPSTVAHVSLLSFCPPSHRSNCHLARPGTEILRVSHMFLLHRIRLLYCVIF